MSPITSNLAHDKMTPHWKITFRLGQGDLLDRKSKLCAFLSGVNVLITGHGPCMDLENSANTIITRDIGSRGARVVHTPFLCGLLGLELSP